MLGSSSYNRVKLEFAEDLLGLEDVFTRVGDS